MEDEIDAFVSEYPPDADPDELAAAIYRQLSHREENIVRIAKRFSEGAHPEIGANLNELLIAGFFGNLPKGVASCNCQWQLGRERNELFAHLAKIISSKPKATDFIRANLNPIVEEMIRAVETQRDDRSFELIHISTCLLAIGLEVAIVAEQSDIRFRTGLASDYIHWAGRLMRSVDTHIRYDGGDRIGDTWRDDIAYLAGRMAAAGKAIGEKPTEALDRVLKDELVLEQFKDQLRHRDEEALPRLPELAGAGAGGCRKSSHEAAIGRPTANSRTKLGVTCADECQLDVGPEGEGWRGHEGTVRFPHDEPNAEVAAIHPKAMPVIPRTPEEIERWMTAPVEDVRRLQHPLPDGPLMIVARGTKEDAPAI